MFPRALLAAAAAGLIGPWMATGEPVCAATPKAMAQAALGAARPSAAPAPASRPATQPAPPGTTARTGSQYGNQPIIGGAKPDGQSPSTAAGGEIGGNIAGTAVSLVVILVLILVGVWVLRRVFPGMRRGAAGGPVHVMGKHYLSAKQQLYLVKIGSRVVVVGAAGGALSSVCQITDAEEIAELTKQCEQQASASITRSFRALFASNRGRMADALSEDLEAGEAPEDVGEVREELDSVVGRLRRSLSSRRSSA